MHITTSDQPRLELGFGGHSCNWGTHIAGLYETEAERDEIIFGFLATGDRAGDLQLYCPSDRSISSFSKDFGARCDDCRDHLHDETRFQISSPRDLYYPDGVFSPWAMDHGLQEFFEASQAAGPRNIRATAEMAWALEAVPGVEHLMAYESRLNFFIPGKPWVSICLYDVTRFDGVTIMNVLRTHPFTVNGGVVTENPFYRNPDEWLAAHAPGFLEDHPH